MSSRLSPHALVPLSRLSCSTICFRLFPLADTLQAIAKLGLTHVDLAALPGFCPHFDLMTASDAEEREFVSIVRASGLSVHTFTSSIGAPNIPGDDPGTLLRAGRRNIRLARELGAQGIVFVNGQWRPREEFPLADDIATAAKCFRTLADEGAAAGVRILVEAPHKTSLLRTPEEAKVLWDAVNHPNFFPILDINHYEAVHWKPRQAADFIGAQRIGIVHLRDGIGRDNRHVLGTGAVDFRELFLALRDGGYTGRYSFEFSDTTETIEGNIGALQRSIEFLASLEP